MLKEMDQKSLTENEEAWRTVCRGVRGATVATENTAEAILSATRELLCSIIYHNQINADDVASVYFTTTTEFNGRLSGRRGASAWLVRCASHVWARNAGPQQLAKMRTDPTPLEYDAGPQGDHSCLFKRCREATTRQRTCPRNSSGRA